MNAVMIRLQQNPNDMPALIEGGHYLLRRMAIAQARPFIDRALQLDPEHQDARALLGVIEIETGDHGEGLQHLRAVVEQCADHPVARAYLQQADSDFQRAS